MIFEQTSLHVNVTYLTELTAPSPDMAPGQTALSTNLSSPNFGQVMSANDPRILQFALKLHF